MNNRRTNKAQKPSRLERIERKCNLILSELAVIKKSNKRRSHSIDDAIELMHRNARRMRAEAEKDARILSKVFHLK